jgi:quercetin dioxygenase-like cupin family protein
LAGKRPEGRAEISTRDRQAMSAGISTATIRTAANSRVPYIGSSRRGKSMFKKTLVIAAFVAPVALGSVFLAPVLAQQTGIKRTPVQTVDFPAGFQTVSAIAEVPAGGCAGRHTHPGVESTYVMEGDITVKIEGKPDQQLKAGQSFQIPEGAKHDACTTGGMKVLAVYIVEKGKPLASPAP